MSAEQGSSIPVPLNDALEEIEAAIDRLEVSNVSKDKRRKMFEEINSGCLAVYTYGQAITRRDPDHPAPSESILNRENFKSVVEVFTALNTIQNATPHEEVIKRLMDLCKDGRTENKCTDSYK